jgi:site-specific DNA recombinase
MAIISDAELTAVYCRKSRKGDKQQITVSRQRRLALDDCAELGLSVNPKNIFIDNGASAWLRNRKRPGWDALMQAARRGDVKHIVCYHPDRLMRQPWDLEELLKISDEYGIMLYGRVNRRNLQDADDRYAIRIEIAHACRSSDDTSRRLKDQKRERAESGLPNGARPYGYAPGGLKIVEAEAVIVREIFGRFTQGETPYAIAADLNGRGICTAKGKAWTEATVRRQLCNKHVAGICWHDGREVAAGKWPPLIARAEWDFAQELLAFRSPAAGSAGGRERRVYLLRGLVTCGNCGTAMPGASHTVYRCTRAQRQDGHRCARTMKAEPLELFVEEAAVRLLTGLAVNPRRSPSASVDAAEREIASDQQQIRDLHGMWLSKEIDTAEYRRDRRVIQARIRENEKKTIVTMKSADAIADLTGPRAKDKWAGLTAERKNSVLRFLFSAVIIGPPGESVQPGTIDFGRIVIEEHELG